MDGTRAALRALGGVLLVVLLASSALAQNGALTEAERATLREIVSQARQEQRIPGMSIAIARDGRLVFAEGFGSVDLEGEVAATADTRYRIASIAKPVTAVAVLQLAAAGKLSLDDPVHERCPGYPAKERDPTVRHLLAHQSGIRHTTDEEDTSIVGSFPRLADAIAPVADEALEFEPGTKTLYTSWGYAILGCVIETVSGQSYMDYITEHVLGPAGMSATTLDRPDFAAPDFSPGYRGQGSRLRPSEVVDTRFKTPASGLISSAPDLVRFALALQSGELLAEDWREAMFEAQTLRDGSVTQHTLGWVTAPRPEGLAAYYSTGSMEGTTAFLYMVPEKGYAVAILANRERYVQELVPLIRRVNEMLIR
jgi:CubicO group peptidase (beta-lactamase class C family)